MFFQVGIQHSLFDVIDPEANIPFVAHVQYWENEALRRALYEAV